MNLQKLRIGLIIFSVFLIIVILTVLFDYSDFGWGSTPSGYIHEGFVKPNRLSQLDSSENTKH